MRNPFHDRRRGFTLMEVIVTLVIIAIIAAVVISGASSTTQPALKANAEKLKVHLRYAQLRALNSTERVWGINFPGGSYSLFYVIESDANAHDLPFPGEDAGTVTLPNTTITLAGGTVLSFDTWGRPYTNGRANFDPSPVPQAADRTITLTDTSGNTETITITRNTGYIP
jgi:prepilin-type N-terminal cleavage/methylation domain-containing protein